MTVSGNGRRRRPFYGEYAWAFDLIIDRPVRKECGAIAAWLTERGVRPGSRLLDAGCGTGRYAIELARRGYVVTGVDASAELIAEAARSRGETAPAVSFLVSDILLLPASSCEAILCRGALDDLLEDGERERAFASFAAALGPDGVLILDVREWAASADRKSREPLFRKRVPTDRGTLEFRSVTEVDQDNRRLIVSERHTLTDGSHERVSDYVFTMRCWTRDELLSMLRVASFTDIALYGAYDPAVGPGSTDRLVAVARLEF